MKLNQALEDHVADALYDSFDGGVLQIFAGNKIIVTIPLPDEAFNPADKGAKTVNGIWQAPASAAGIASDCVFESSDGKKSLEGTVTKKGKGGDVELDNVNIETGQMVIVRDGDGSVGG